MPRPRSLTNATIGAAALAVLDRDGLEGLSMRSVATELGVGTMSVYRYVSGREELEGLIVDAVLSTVDTSVSGAWRVRVTTLLGRMRTAIGEHPAVVPVLLTRRVGSPAALAFAEVLLVALSDAGLTGKRRAIAFRTLSAFVIGAIQSEHLGPLLGGDPTGLDAYPTLVQTAAAAARLTADDDFRRGLDAVLDGLV